MCIYVSLSAYLLFYVDKTGEFENGIPEE